MAMLKYVYFVFKRKFQTSQGKAFVHVHERDYDAQNLYQELLAYHKRSTKGLITTSTILAYLMSAKLGNGTWKGTTQDFLLHWHDQLRQYENMVSPQDFLTNTVKRILLENAVHPVDDLRRVKAESDQHLSRTGRPLSFEQYQSLLTSAVITYDARFLHTKCSNIEIGVS